MPGAATRMLRHGFLLSVGMTALFFALPALAQTPPADNPPPSQPQPKPIKNADNATQAAPDQPTWDPLRADRDMEVGKYYMRKGDVDAAIDRFEDATQAKPGFALPFLYLGEAYEKKGKKNPAVKAYQRYLDLDPKAEDGDKIRKKIEKLHQEIDKEKKDIY
jgi:tetratricopeptide (TPR) repeat protein